MTHAPRSPLVGREVEVAALAGVIEDALAAHGRLALIAGEPGAGKSRLADELAREATDRGALVLWGRAWEAGGAPAFWPWLQVVRGLARRAPAGVDPGELARLVGALGAAGGGGTDDRFLLFDDVATALVDAAARGPLVVVLEDLHAADPSTLSLLAFVAGQLHGTRLAIVATYRDAEVRADPARAAAMAPILRHGEVIPVGPLAPAAVAALCQAALGDAPDAVAEVQRAAGGNPLFVHELLIVRRAGDAGPRAPGDGVRAAIREHLRALPAAARPVLELAAVIGREVDVGLLAELAGGPVDAALADAARAGVLVEQGPGRHAFRHVLLRDVLHQDVPEPRRPALHLALARALAARHAGDPAAPLDEIAHHLSQAGPAHQDEAIEVALAASARAVRQLAFEDAAALAERALATLEAARPGDARARIEACLAVARARLLAGDAAAGRRRGLEAAELARGLGSAELLAAAALTLGADLQFAVVDPSLVALLGEALAGLPPGDGAVRARLAARLAAARQPAEDPEGPVAEARAAIEMARRVGDADALLAVLHHAGSAMVDYADPVERLAIDRELVDRARAAGDAALAVRGAVRVVFDLLELNDVAAADEALGVLEALVADRPHPRYRWTVSMFRALRALLEGRFADDLRWQDEARRTGAEAVAANLRFALLAHGVVRAYTTGEPLGVALEDMPAPARQRRRITAWIRAWTGDAEATRAALAGLSDAERTPGDAEELLWMTEASFVAGEPAQLARLYERARPLRGRNVVFTSVGFGYVGPIDRVLFLAAWGSGELAAADRHWHDAWRAAERAGARPVLARLAAERARFLRERGDGPATAAAAADAVARARALGIEPLIRRIAGFELGDAPPPARAARVALTLEGEVWAVAGVGEQCRIKDSRGMRMLAALVAEPGRERHALDLAGGGERVDLGDGGDVLDPRAIADYRRRLAELAEEIEEAEAWNDPGRATRARAESEALAAELSRAVGLGGRTRRTGAASERARSNVQRRLADAIRRITEAAPRLGRHLQDSVKTGTFCVFSPPEA